MGDITVISAAIGRSTIAGTVGKGDASVVSGELAARRIVENVTPEPCGRSPDATEGGGVDLTVCFLEGTRLLGLHGDIAVEDMEPGDRLITDSGAMRPVKWVGRRLIEATRHPRPETVWPIRIEAGAIDHGWPERPLYLSPDHGVYLDGYLVPAKALLNGRSIIQEKRDRIIYYHVELESHDILLAESLPVESYLDTGHRDFFENGTGAMVLHPHLTQTTRMAGCAPFIDDGDGLDRIRQRLMDRLPALQRSADCRLRALRNSVELPVTAIDQLNFRVDLADSQGDLVLLSNAMVPAECDAASRDRRRLGIDVASLEVETVAGNRRIALSDRSLRSGWHNDEFTHRWTNGEAVIPAAMLEGGHALSIRLNETARYVVDPAAERNASRVADLVMTRQMSALRQLGLLE